MPPPIHPPILPLGYSEAAMFLQSPTAPKIAALISIHGNREYPLECNVPHRLDLDFDDIDAHDPTDPIATYHAIQRARQDAENGLKRRPPTPEDAAAIIHFAESIRDVKGTVLCHCGAGISRSPAAALICLATWTGPGNEKYCVKQLLKSRPSAQPHPDLLRFADKLLNRHGKLVEALAKGSTNE